MNSNLRAFLNLLLGSFLFWVLAFILFNTIRYNGLSFELKTYSEDDIQLPIRSFYAYSVLLGLILGFFYAIIEFCFDLYVSKKLILGVTIFLKSLVYFILIITVLSLLSLSIEKQVGIELDNDRGWWRNNPFFWNTVIYFITASIVFSFIRIANDKFGRGVFLNMLLGTYKRPKEEERILMFVDLKDSTKIAEQLGHEVYSRFIQDCFKDLNKFLRTYDAEVYQYVGDEAVISWINKRGFKNNNCINLFLSFENALLKKSNYYKGKYNFVPVFKAGIHSGKIMIAEVGTVKKELAFHGDVINSASRIQSLCNDYHSTLLISETVLHQINNDIISYEEIKEDFTLKGKQKAVKVYKVTSK
ncbi:adenylate/guanylate cyclase domain-containing protein [Psychroserpens sp.]|uniref:adenylate/guanylate cyclase domain-containing protein n=1 Tax=Psychroserpens sp. TaxID=2020870 RepID=UPI00385B3A2B